MRIGKLRRQPVYSDAAVQGMSDKEGPFWHCSATNVQVGVRGLFCLVDLEWQVLDFSTLSSRREKLVVDIPHREGALITALAERQHGDQDGVWRWEEGQQARLHQNRSALRSGDDGTTNISPKATGRH